MDIESKSLCVLSPLALSHAILGFTFYYWIYGEDLLGAWRAGLVALIGY
jgi:hypothetical protein